MTEQQKRDAERAQDAAIRAYLDNIRSGPVGWVDAAPLTASTDARTAMTAHEARDA